MLEDLKKITLGICTRFIKNFWSYKHKTPERKPVTRDIKNLILEMKQENYLWGCKKISNELKNINIDIHYTTVNRIINIFQKQGLIQPNGSWKKFLKMHWESLKAMDFMTIDTLFGKRLYLLIILALKTRKIVKKYVEYYNQRPHQGINKIPDGETASTTGMIKKAQILGVLHHHCYRSSA